MRAAVCGPCSRITFAQHHRLDEPLRQPLAHRSVDLVAVALVGAHRVVSLAAWLESVVQHRPANMSALSAALDPAQHLGRHLHDSPTCWALHFSVSDIQSRRDPQDPLALVLQ